MAQLLGFDHSKLAYIDWEPNMTFGTPWRDKAKLLPSE